MFFAYLRPDKWQALSKSELSPSCLRVPASALLSSQNPISTEDDKVLFIHQEHNFALSLSLKVYTILQRGLWSLFPL